MLIGPVFTRELVVSPRRLRLYVARAVYALGLLVLIATASALVTGHQKIRNVGDMARFGSLLFQFLAPLQLMLAMVFSALLSAGAVAQEKDRRTLVLLLMTRLNNSELVLGKLMSSMLLVLTMLAAAVPVFLLCMLFGGISLPQIGRVFGVTLMSSLAAGSLGSLIAFWREQTFQALALTLLLLVFWLLGGEALRAGMLGTTLATLDAEAWAILISPYRAVEAATQTQATTQSALPWLGHPANGCLFSMLTLAAVCNLVAMWRVRRWNTGGERGRTEEAERERERLWQTKAGQVATSADPQSARKQAAAPYRHAWDNPVLWREMRTWAYGRKILLIRGIYLLLAAACGLGLYYFAQAEEGLSVMQAATVLAPLFVLSLILVNAQAVTSFCAERDGRTLDLLLVSDLTPSELIFGKVWGVLYNAREMIVVPALMVAALLFVQDADMRPMLTGELLVYLLGGLAVLIAFCCVLGLHAGMTYWSSRTAILASLGTVVFLFVGIFTCIRMIITFSGTFELQMTPFVVFMVGGGVGLFAALGYRNPSSAILITSFVCPFATFYAITSFLLGQSLNVFLVVAFTYGFATAAMLVPAVSEFDVALGRTIGEEHHENR